MDDVADSLRDEIEQWRCERRRRFHRRERGGRSGVVGVDLEEGPISKKKKKKKSLREEGCRECHGGRDRLLVVPWKEQKK